MKNGNIIIEDIENDLFILIQNNMYEHNEIELTKDIFIDLDFDSLAFSSLIVDIEKHFKIEINQDDILKNPRTPMDLIELISSKLNK